MDSLVGGRGKTVYWTPVIFAAVFFVLFEQMRLAVVVASLLILSFKRKGDVSLSLPRHAGLLVAILAIGLLSGFVNGQIDTYGPYKFLRDMAYYISPFLLWILGSAFGSKLRTANMFWTTLFFMAFASALSMFAQGALDGGAASLGLDSFSANEMVVYAPVLIALSPRSWEWKREHRKAAYAMALVSVAAIIVSLSRTTLICMMLLLLAFAVRSFSRSVKYASIAVVLAMFFVAAMSLFPSSVSNEFFDKIGNSLTEVSSSERVWDATTVNTNWRGYEKYCAEVDFNNADTATKLFGHGYGFLMDVGAYTALVTSDAGLPFLHNGYYSLLVKCGLVGVFLLLVFYALHAVALYGRWIRSGDEMIGLALGTILCLIVCSYVIEGLFIPSSLYFFTLPLAMIFGLKKSHKKTSSQMK